MCIYVHVYAYAYAYVYVYIYMYMCIICMHIYIYICIMSIYINTEMYTRMNRSRFETDDVPGGYGRVPPGLLLQQLAAGLFWLDSV